MIHRSTSKARLVAFGSEFDEQTEAEQYEA